MSQLLLLSSTVIEHLSVHHVHNQNEVKALLISRFFQEDQEMHILTQSDELNRTFNEDSTRSVDINQKNNIRVKETSLSAEVNASSPAPDSLGSTQRPSLKATRTTLSSSGPTTTAVPAAVSAARRAKKKASEMAAAKRRSCRQNVQELEFPVNEKQEEGVMTEPDASGEDPSSSPAPTITSWEAGWNVTNAIQVREDWLSSER